MNNKIVLAYNEADAMELSCKRLTDKGFDVYPTQDGRKAYDLIIKFVPDLIISDTVMPTMSGFELCKAVKNNAQTKDIPIIVLLAQMNMQDSFLYLGVKDFVPKPVVLDQLEEVVKSRIALEQAMHNQKTKLLFHSITPSVINKATTLMAHTPQWKAEFVGSGLDAMAKVVSNVPDIIVLDLFMKDVPINELIAKLKSMEDLAKTDILVYYSPNSATMDSFALQARSIEIQFLKQVALEAGAKEYIGPFHPDHFMDLMNPYRKDLSGDFSVKN